MERERERERERDVIVEGGGVGRKGGLYRICEGRGQ
jgi:hypothetical protein